VAEVVWTAEAERSLRAVHDFIALDSPVNAFNVVQAIYARAQILSQFPLLGYAYRSPSGRDTRILLWGHYRIVYMARGDLLHILGVFHGAMELKRYFAG
jgi:plasmid stabilization system protein ParE